MLGLCVPDHSLEHSDGSVESAEPSTRAVFDAKSNYNQRGRPEGALLVDFMDRERRRPNSGEGAR
jgi:hypothetical protein